MSKTEIVSEIRIKDFKIEELKTPYSDTLGTPEIPLVYAIVETPDGEKKIELGINVEDIPSIAKDNVKLVTIMIKALIKELGINVEDIVEYTEFITRLTTRSGELASKLMNAYRRYYYKLTGIGVRELEEILVPKTRIYIEKQLKTAIYTSLIILHELGKNPIIIGYGSTPKQQEELIRSLFHKDLSTIEVLEKLGLKDIDIDRVRPYTREYPYLLVYKSGNLIVFSREPLPRGEVSLRLRIPSRQELEKIFQEIPDIDAENLIKNILNVLGIGYINFIRSLGKKGEVELSVIVENFIDKYGKRIRIGEQGLDREYIDYYMIKWPEYIKGIFELIEGDPLIITFYKSMFLPYYRPEWSPHTLIITSTNAGKTLLYRLFTGRDPLSDVTPRTLVGHYSLEEKRVVKGILHGKHIAVQIENLESKTAKDTLAFLMDYMKSGKACRGVQREICIEGTAPVILTGNTIKTKKKAYTLQNWIKLGLLDNPEGLGSRMLLFYKTMNRLKIKDLRRLEKLLNIIREIRDSSTIRQKLRKIWDLPQIEEWINTPDKLEIDISIEEELSELKQYFEVLTDNFYTRLKAIALNNVLMDYLDQIHYNDMKYIINTLLHEILEKAQEIYEILKVELIDSIKNIQLEYSFKDPTSIALSLTKPFKQLLVSINDYLHKQVLNKDIVKIDLDDLMEFMKSQGIKRTNDLKYKIKTKLMADTINRYLRSLGIYMVITDNDKIIISIETSIFNTIDFEQLVRSLEETKI